MRAVTVVGGSLAGVQVVKTLRNRGFDGAITLVGDEVHLPYDRPPLSKSVLTGEADADTLGYLDRAWFDDHAIELRLGERATRLDITDRTIYTDSSTLHFSDLVIATGARARNPFTNTPTGVFTLRTIDDALQIRDALSDAKYVVVVGGGFIGLEVASAARSRGTQVTIVEAAEIPLSRNVGTDVAPALSALARTHGITLTCGRSVASIDGTAHVESITLDNGTLIRCDTVIVGVGAIPNTDWLTDSGLELGPAGLVCDRTGRAAPHIWAAGDVCAWRDTNETPHRHEHWTSAGEQARTVAHNLLDNGNRTVEAAPFVWSDQFGKRISIIGDTTGHDTVRFLSRGTEDLGALYSRDGKFVGACVVGQLRLVLKCRKWAAAGTHTSEIPEWELADL
ncbi:NAD(P)/FAD-dependent oxidoreductase [Rhodococcus opacus]|uniref:Pyridine nucleotide-disulfide oxidoreductase n=1 Tax=Rhodococcus opacus TaxID=37919 RepID=A0A076EZF8_RHOOP|nr:FAD-dependent oxidoreductase [Rhodococcus opacus]AII10627.1 pyridine nucleotide-disulfide oxidoreductase [Rhodococcus opacus]